jgi:predicted adenylyl cyclase CyaB
MRNLELKAAFDDLQRGEQIALAMGAAAGGDLHQVDTYFHVPEGRLKLREINHAGGELIFYHRQESEPTRFSDYYTAPVADCTQMLNVLSRSLRVRIRIEKARRLYLYRGARVHLDRVSGLGNFIEFEVPVESNSAASEAVARGIMEELMGAFRLRAADAIQASYSDLADTQ